MYRMDFLFLKQDTGNKKILLLRNQFFLFGSPLLPREGFEAGKTGARWCGDAAEKAPEMLDAAMIFAPVGDLMKEALLRMRKGDAVKEKS